MQSSSLIRICKSPCTSRSVAPKPNLLYNMVSPTETEKSRVCVPTLPSPKATTSPVEAAHLRVSTVLSLTCSASAISQELLQNAPDVGRLWAENGSKMPEVVFSSRSATLASTKSPFGATWLTNSSSITSDSTRRLTEPEQAQQATEASSTFENGDGIVTAVCAFTWRWIQRRRGAKVPCRGQVRGT